MATIKSIEEKAKAYDEAIEALRSLFAEQAIKHCDRVNIKDITNIFSELKESEDERIRKKVIDVLKLNVRGAESQIQASRGVDRTFEVYACNKVIDWLEKQGKQKPADKIQIGKKYKCIASPRYSTFMIGEIYKPEDKFLCSLMNFCSDCFEAIEDDGQKHTEYNREIPTNLTDIVDKEANAIWKEESTDGCHLVIDSFNMFFGICMQIAEAVVDYKKPAEWSKEDKINYNRIRTILCTHNDVREEEYKKLTSWLKSLRPQDTWKPSEEQMKALEHAISCYSGISPTNGHEVFILEIMKERLKNLMK